MTKKKHPKQEMAPGRKRIFFAITIAIPVFFFVSLELALRWLQYGADVSLFGHQEIRGQVYTVMNPDVKFRYFGTLQFTPATSLHYFLTPKPEGVYRIFCLGGSTTCGYPYYFNASFSSFLSGRLNALFPKKNIEIINLGMTATNSFTVLDIAKELSHYQPDLIIDYDGHNEFYGALGVASHQTIGPSRFVTLLYLRMIHFRTFQLLGHAVQKLAGLFHQMDNTVSRGTMMETLARGQEVPCGSPLYDKAYETFRENLQDLKTYCRTARIPLILGTQVSNLRDQPPFVSGNSPGVSQQRTLFQQLYSGGIELQSRGLVDSAIGFFRSAIPLDSLHADTHYRIAQCLDLLGRKREALSEYILARDSDELRFRTDSRFNNLIRSMQDSNNCFVADIEATLKSLSQDSLIGHNLTLDHLHPTSRGYYYLAKTYAQVMRENSLLAARQEWNAADTLDEDDLWKERFVTDLDERMAIQSVNVITSGWPFKSHSATIGFIPPTDTLNQIAQKLAVGKLGWLEAHMQAINYYRQRGDWASIEWEYKTILSLYPHIIQPYLDLAAVYFQQERFDDMKTLLLRSLQVVPTLPAYSALGNILLDKDDPVGALKYFEKMDTFVQNPSEKLQNGYRISVAYARAGEYQKAKERLVEVLRLKPDFQPALQLLTEINRRMEERKSTPTMRTPQ